MSIDVKVTCDAGDFAPEQKEQLTEAIVKAFEDLNRSVDVQVTPQVGDVIRLNSGGPLMTITEVKNDYICAQWFTETAEPHVLSDTFYNGTFTKAN